MIHSIPNLLFNRLQANVLKRMQYKIQTIYGTSTKTYSNSAEIPIHGQGQGTGSAGTTWAFHSIPMMRVIEKACSGCVMGGRVYRYLLQS